MNRTGPLATVFARKHSCRGFTLIEVSVVLGVSAVLTALAVPAYFDQLARSRRSDATAALQQVQWAQERHLQAHGRYAETLGELRGRLPGGAAQRSQAGLQRSEAGHYRVELVSHGPNAYDALALAEPSQSRDRDCQALTLQVQGAITQRQPSAGCWGI